MNVEIVQYVSTRKATRILGVSRRTLLRWKKRGHLRASKTPTGQWRWKLNELYRLFDRSA